MFCLHGLVHRSLIIFVLVGVSLGFNSMICDLTLWGNIILGVNLMIESVKGPATS